MTILLAALMMLSGMAMAAEWTDGRSPAQPYGGVPEVDLNRTMGYIMLYPRTKMPANQFCDALEIYLPREDVALGSGILHLYEVPEGGRAVEAEAVNFADAEAVSLRPMTEAELEGLKWGGGVCITVKLLRSLTIGKSYYVLMDGGCFTTANGAVRSLPINTPEAWTPVVQGDYGVSRLFYREAPEVIEIDPETIELDENGDPILPKVPEEKESDIVVKRVPAVGDLVVFDLTMGGDAAAAVLYSENDSVRFEQQEYTESATVTGEVVGEELRWGVVFLDANGNVLTAVDVD